MKNEIEMTVNAVDKKQALGIIDANVKGLYASKVKYASLISVKRSSPLDQYVFLVTLKS